MLKQIIAIIVVSIAITLAMSSAQQSLQLLLHAHNWVAMMLADVFSAGQAGNIARDLIALLSMPILIGLIPTIAYWAIRRNWFPYFMQTVWIIWLIQAGALLIKTT